MFELTLRQNRQDYQLTLQENALRFSQRFQANELFLARRAFQFLQRNSLAGTFSQDAAAAIDRRYQIIGQFYQ